MEEKNKRNVEFHIGATVFSIIGAAFILTAVIILGVNYLDRFFMQLMVYGVSAFVILLSELVLRRLSGGFANVITSLGLGGLFVATVINDTIKGYMFGTAALAAGFVIGILGIILGRVRGSLLIRIVTLIGFYAVFVVSGALYNEFKLMLLAVLLLLFNLTGIFVPNKKHESITAIINMVFQIFYSFFLIMSASRRNPDVLYVIFMLITLLIACEALILRGDRAESLALTLTGAIASGFMLTNLVRIFADFGYHMSSGFMSDAGDVRRLIYRIVTAILIMACCLVIYGLLKKESPMRTVQLYFILLSIVLIEILSGNAGKDNLLIRDYEKVIVLSIVYIVFRIMGRKKEHALTDIVYACVFSIIMLPDLNGIFGRLLPVIPSLIALLVLIAGMLIFKNYYIANEIVSTLGIAAVASGIIKYVINLYIDYNADYGIGSIITALIMIYFVMLSRFKNENQKPYIITCLIIQVLFFAVFVIRSFYESTVILSSVLFMLSAVIYVCCGFIKDNKLMRIVGLVLAGLVCIKLVGWDLKDVELLYRIIAFMGVGILALVISMVYVKLEKKLNKGQGNE